MHPSSPAFEYNQSSSLKSSCTAILQAVMKRKLNSLWYTERILKFSRQIFWEGNGTHFRLRLNSLNYPNQGRNFAAALLQAKIRRRKAQEHYVSVLTQQQENLDRFLLPDPVLLPYESRSDLRSSEMFENSVAKTRSADLSEGFYCNELEHTPQPRVSSGRIESRKSRLHKINYSDGDSLKMDEFFSQILETKYRARAYEPLKSLSTPSSKLLISGSDGVALARHEVSDTEFAIQGRENVQTFTVESPSHGETDFAVKSSGKIHSTTTASPNDVVLTSIALLTLSREMHNYGFEEDASEFLYHALASLRALGASNPDLDCSAAMRDCLQSSCLADAGQWRRLKRHLDTILPSPDKRNGTRAVPAGHALDPPSNRPLGEGRRAVRGPSPMFEILGRQKPEAVSHATCDALRQLPSALAAGLPRRRLAQAVDSGGLVDWGEAATSWTKEIEEHGQIPSRKLQKQSAIPAPFPASVSKWWGESRGSHINAGCDVMSCGGCDSSDDSDQSIRNHDSSWRVGREKGERELRPSRTPARLAELELQLRLLEGPASESVAAAELKLPPPHLFQDELHRPSWALSFGIGNKVVSSGDGNSTLQISNWNREQEWSVESSNGDRLRHPFAVAAGTKGVPCSGGASEILC